MTELTRAEEEALESLRDVPPPAGAEARIRDALHARGALIDGWKLTDDGRMVDPSSGMVRTSEFAVAAGELGGLFIIRANSYDEAVAIAETCPHVRYGGRMEVRAVDL